MSNELLNLPARVVRFAGACGTLVLDFDLRAAHLIVDRLGEVLDGFLDRHFFNNASFLADHRTLRTLGRFNRAVAERICRDIHGPIYRATIDRDTLVRKFNLLLNRRFYDVAAHTDTAIVDFPLSNRELLVHNRDHLNHIAARRRRARGCTPETFARTFSRPACADPCGGHASISSGHTG